ncbi:MAG: 50S ribosomal protein L29 [Actinobacteria bacterium]|jgi:large subunit ribosomal protein L29|nr:50S ribosomal protein L29 [Actinomycetota bacterium]MCZ6518327.1 50S ribosomal protein L29 [Actinomycetota bacterium]MCZ6568502.1 50S ribosomal protein L29 [Actinomycetota bacterium]MCZ6631014.1 50S ribosomal protein L29 [Actinomycetota bacterium]MCZ6736641.1 50S ribosomal protein L29 [Actinomycetota bacterium]
MTIVEIRELTTEELVDALAEAKEEKFNLRFQVATNQLDNTARIGVVKTDIARILTVIRERELIAAGEVAAEEIA